MPRQINDAALHLIESFETLQLTVYDDGFGFRTIGYGHKLLPTDRYQTITEDEAEALLYYDLRIAEEGIAKACSRPLNDNQFGALVSLAFNCGVTAISQSTLIRLLNAGDYEGAANQFLRWNKVGGIEVRGLTRRRAAEAALFRTPPTA